MSFVLSHRFSSLLFALWGLLHMIGGSAILIALSDGADAGYAVYQLSSGAFPPLAGQVLGYLAFLIAGIGAGVVAVAATLNWRNSALGLALNTMFCGTLDLGLIIFLVLPGHVSWLEAGVGLALLVGGAVAGGVACRAPRGVRI